VTLRQAPRFSAYFERAQGGMRMPRADWNRICCLHAGEVAELDVSLTPIAAVAAGSRIEAVVAERRSDLEVVVDVYRYDPEDEPLPINLDRYRVRERLPHDVYRPTVNAASTEDNPNFRDFLDDYVFLEKAEVARDEHHLPGLPPRVRELLSGHGNGPA